MLYYSTGLLNFAGTKNDFFCLQNHTNTIIMLKLFKIVALLEGVSYLALFANMLFIKTNNPELYKTLLFPIGMAHGILFIGYLLLAIMLKFEANWPWKKFGIICLGSLVPFGAFYVEQKYLKHA